MFSKDDLVVNGFSGICTVKDVGNISIGGADENRLYYTLEPLNRKGSKVYTPVDNVKVLIRSVISREEAEKLIDNIPNIDTIWISDDKKREQIYKNSVRKCSCEEWVKIIKTLYLRKIDRQAHGKKVTETDKKYLKIAEDSLYSELAIPFHMTRDEVEEFVIKRVREKEAEKANNKSESV